MNKIICRGFEIVEGNLPDNCGMICTEKQKILFKVSDGELEFWNVPRNEIILNWDKPK